MAQLIAVKQNFKLPNASHINYEKRHCTVTSTKLTLRPGNFIMNAIVARHAYLKLIVIEEISIVRIMKAIS